MTAQGHTTEWYSWDLDPVCLIQRPVLFTYKHTGKARGEERWRKERGGERRGGKGRGGEGREEEREEKRKRNLNIKKTGLKREKTDRGAGRRKNRMAGSLDGP